MFLGPNMCIGDLRVSAFVYNKSFYIILGALSSLFVS